MKNFLKLTLLFCLALVIFACSKDDDDTSNLPELSISDADAVNEGGTAVFILSLSAASTDTIRFKYATADGTTTTTDYLTTGGAVSSWINPGTMSGTITVKAQSDQTTEPAETFKVVLSDVKNARLADAEGTATINAN